MDGGGIGWEIRVEGRRQVGGVNYGGGGDGDGEDSLGEGGDYQILEYLGADRLVKLWICCKE